MTGETNLLKLVEAPGEANDYQLQEQVGFILRKAHQRHVSIFAQRIGDLTPPQFAAMAKLHETGETSQNQLGTLIAMDAATIKGVIDRLKARGLVELAPHAADRRRVVVNLTQEGRDTIENFDRRFEEFFTVAKTMGFLRPDSDPQILTQMISGLTSNLLVRARAGASRQELQKITESTTAFLFG